MSESVRARIGPGLAKARKPALTASRTRMRVTLSGTRFGELLARADVLSEGVVRDDGGEPTWFGSTSLLLALDEHHDDLAGLSRLVAHDVHARTRLLRFAQREASLRAPRPLGRASCELRIEPHPPRGLRIDVDVQAPLIEVRSRGRQRAH